MVMSYVWALLLGGSVVCAILTGRGQALSAGVMQGAQTGVTLAISIGGSLCLWSGVGRLMKAVGATDALSRLLRPLLGRIFPESHRDASLAGALSGNICANLLGLGNAATPLGIRAARRMAIGAEGLATDELCLLVVLNTASIQLLPTTIAGVRAAHGCRTPFDILPAVWFSSVLSVAAGLLMAKFLSRLWRN